MFLHARPPIGLGDELLGVESSGVSSYDGVVVFLNDLCLKWSVGGYIDEVLVGNESISVVTVDFVC
jgi:hypothetical protein